MRKRVGNAVMKMRTVVCKGLLGKSDGIDGLIVTVGLCIIALLLCITMKDQLAAFISTITGNLTSKAQSILGV